MESSEYYEEIIASKEIKSVACFPIKNKKSLIGVIYLENNISTSEFNEQKVVMLTLLSAICATSFENVLNFTKMQKLKENLEIKVQERTLNLEIEQKKRIEAATEYRKKLEEFISKICHEIRFCSIFPISKFILFQQKNNIITETH